MTAIPRTLETLSYRALTDLETKIRVAKDRQYDEATKTVQNKVREFLQTMSAELGIKPEDAGVKMPRAPKHANHRRRVRKASVPVKYRDPNNADNTWTGRGMPPRWLAAAEKKGAQRDQFLIR